MADKRFLHLIAGSVARIRKHICNCESGNYITRRVTPTNIPNAVSKEEARVRESKLRRFRDLNPQTVDLATYTRFVRALYPLSDNLGRFSTAESSRSMVNHTELLDAYHSLPKPGVAYIKPQDFETFMALAIDRRNFVKPNGLAPSSQHYFLSEQIINAYTQAVAARKQQLSDFWRITDDLNVAEVPVSKSEHRQLLFMAFYKDKPEILEMVERALENLSKSLDIYEDYFKKLRNAQETPYLLETVNQVRKSLEKDMDTDTLNMLLFSAFRHKDEKTKEAIIDELELMEPSRDTFRILFEGYSYENALRPFSLNLHLLSTTHMEMLDVKLLNTLIQSLVRLNLIEQAESLVETFDKSRFRPLTENEQFLKLLTIDDRQKYSQYWSAFEDLRENPAYSIYPTENTFFPLLSAYCSANTEFDKIAKILYQAEQIWGIPITSRTYKQIFHSFTKSDHSAEDLRFVTGKLITSHDSMYGATDLWLRNQMQLVELPGNVASVLLEFIESENNRFQPENACLVKLSDELVQAIYTAFLTVLRGQPESLERAGNSHAKFKKHLGKAREEYRRGITPKPSLADLGSRDEFTYIKKAFIIELLDIVS